MVIGIILTTIFSGTASLILMLRKDGIGVMGFLAILLLIVSWAATISVSTKDTVNECLLKDNKIEWKVSKDGQPYLTLKDSTLKEVWKYLK